MRIILHAGLHKSGTTFVQHAWASAYAEGAGGAWYPSQDDSSLPGHHQLARPLLTAFTDEPAADLVLPSLTAPRRPGGLAAVVDEAQERRVAALVLSSEAFDRLREPDVAPLRAALAGHEVTVLLTVTRPMHRWCSGWQELVKHGLAHYPREAGGHVVDFAALRVGRLAELVELVAGAGATRTVLRLVRTSPPEESLATDLATAVGLPSPPEPSDAGPRNPALGTDAEVVRRMNAADVSLGTRHGGRRLLRSYRGDGFAYRDVPGLAEHYEPPSLFWDGARAELDYLGRTPDGVEVLDPHALLADWLDPTPSPWYAAISGREAVVPELDDPMDPAEQLWRARQRLRAVNSRPERRQPG